MADKSNAYHDFETPEGRRFAFQKPTTAQIDALVARARKSPTQATALFTLAIIEPAQRAEWEALLSDKPGYATEVVEAVMEKLGFPIRG